MSFLHVHVHGTAFERNRSLGFYGGGGGGGYITKRCIMGNVKMVNLKISGS